MHKQRVVIIALSLVAILGCFLPWKYASWLATVRGIPIARAIALGLFGVVLVLALLGNWRKEMPWTSHLGSTLGAVLIALVCLYRIVIILGHIIPTFDDGDPHARGFYQKACDEREMKACLLLGECYWTGTCGVSKDTDRAVELYEKACNGGVMGACSQLGSCFEFGECGLRKNGQRASGFYQQACQGGEMDMCNNLGVCYHKGQCGLSRDVRQAAKLYQKACDGGYSGACHNLDLISSN
jgi:TPR repeat protein